MSSSGPEVPGGLTVRMTRDSVGVITSVDESIVEMLGWRPEQLVGSPSTTFLHPEDQASGIATWLDMITAPGSTRVWRGRYQTADGLWKWVQTVNRLEDSDNPVVVSLMTPVTMEQAGVEEDLRAREQLLSRLSDALPVGLFQIDVTGNVTFTNDRLHSIVGVPPTATIDAQMSTVVATDRPILQAAVAAVLADQAVDDVEIRLHLPAEVPAEVSADVSAANEERVCLLSLRALTDGSGIVSGAVGCLSDVTDRVHLRQELELRASVDKLTSCLNRAATLELLERTIRTAGMAGEGSAVVFIDLDGFKSVNDRFGHAAGDSLLVAAADRLRGAVRDCDQVGRLGGDEFLVICPGVKSSAQAIRLADRVAAAITATIDVGPVAVELRASVGVAWTTEALDADMFIARADSAMYESKRTHGGGVTLFTPSSDDASPTGERQPARSRRRAVTTGRSNPPSR